MSSVDFLDQNPDGIIAGVSSDNATFSNDNYLITNTFYSSNVIFVGKSGEKFVFTNKEKKYKIAIPKSYIALKAYTKENYPNYEVITYDTTKECLKAVKNGDVDLFAQNQDVITPYLQNPHYTDLVALPSIYMNEKLSAVSNNDETNQTIISIINKSVEAFNDDEVNQITIDNTLSNAYTPTLLDTIYKYRILFSISCVLLFFCFVLMLTISETRKKNVEKTKQKNEQLAIAIDQANRANESKSMFLSRMSHEIRTPMNAIVGITEIAKHHSDEPNMVSSYLDKIDVSSKVLLNLINDVLDMSAIENEKLKIASNPFNFKSLLSSISTIYYPQCQEKGVAFNMMIENIFDEELIGDSLRVNQILLNLISNAYKFTDKGGKISVKVSQVSKTKKHIYIRFIVSDTGCGMTKEIQDKIFKPFEQESALTAKKYGGSGLGMSITKNIVDLMHGAINVESEKGIGTTITVDIPFKYEERLNKKNDINNEDFSSLKALIIDDDPNEREYTQIILERMGVQYSSVSSGEEAYELLEKKKDINQMFDVCFVDWKMSENVSGIDVTKRIREIFGKETVIVIVSAFDMSEVEDEAKSAGANLFISKPIFQSTIFNVLMNIRGKNHIEQKNDNAYDFTGKTVLLAEDNKLNQEIAVELLTMVGFDVNCADDGQEAYDMFVSSSENTYDIILMDIQMPILDGYEATKKIRKSTHSQAKTIPIYAMTANAFSQDISAAYSAGMNGHISKPIDTKLLYQTLSDELKSKD